MGLRCSAVRTSRRQSRQSLCIRRRNGCRIGTGTRSAPSCCYRCYSSRGTASCKADTPLVVVGNCHAGVRHHHRVAMVMLMRNDRLGRPGCCRERLSLAGGAGSWDWGHTAKARSKGRFVGRRQSLLAQGRLHLFGVGTSTGWPGHDAHGSRLFARLEHGCWRSRYRRHGCCWAGWCRSGQRCFLTRRIVSAVRDVRRLGHAKRILRNVGSRGHCAN